MIRADLLSTVAVDYGASAIVAKEGSSAEQGDGTDVSVSNAKDRVISDQSLCSGITVGMRIPSHKVLSQADARPWHLHEVLPSNGRWRVIVFAGNTNDDRQRDKLWKVSEAFSAPNSFLNLYTPKGARYDEVFEVLLVHKAPRQSVTVLDFPEVFRPYDEVDGWDYNKIFVDDVSYHEGFGDIYGALGIPQDGCIVIVRPDQYVSYVGSMEEPAAVNSFFAGFMKEQQAPNEVQANGTKV